MTFELTLTQTWGSEKHTIVQRAFLEKSYPIWLTAAAMDTQMYRATGMVLPSRQWESRLVSLQDD